MIMIAPALALRAGCSPARPRQNNGLRAGPIAKAAGDGGSRSESTPMGSQGETLQSRWTAPRGRISGWFFLF